MVDLGFLFKGCDSNRFFFLSFLGKTENLNADFKGRRTIFIVFFLI